MTEKRAEIYFNKEYPYQNSHHKSYYKTLVTFHFHNYTETKQILTLRNAVWHFERLHSENADIDDYWLCNQCKGYVCEN